MDASLTAPGSTLPRRSALLVTALSPVIPQVLGSIFNIWYNMVVIEPLLVAAHLTERFVSTVIVWNGLIYPVAIGIWLWWVFSLRGIFRSLLAGEAVPAARVNRGRRRLANLPWFGAGLSGAAWLLGIPFFLISFALTGRPVDAQLFWHLPISLAVSGFMAMTQSFFLIELASHWGLFPIFFRDARPDQLKGIHPISLRTRGLM